MLKLCDSKGVIARPLLIPTDGVMTAYLRLEIEIFDSKIRHFYAIFETKGEDEIVIEEFGQKTLSYW